jgi:hypothetical protein
VRNVTAAAHGLDDEPGVHEVDSAEILAADEGTPIEGVVAAAPPLPTMEANFVAGEIDVPSPPPRRERTDRDHDTPAVEFTAASGILGSLGESDNPDTGSRTPPLERR